MCLCSQEFADSDEIRFEVLVSGGHTFGLHIDKQDITDVWLFEIGGTPGHSM